MQTRNASEAKSGGGTRIEAGTYEAQLQAISCWTNTKYQSTENEPTFMFHWSLGFDESGNELTTRDNFIRLPIDKEGYPYMNDESKLYNRASAALGERFDAKTVTWGFAPQNPQWAFETLEDLLALPHQSEMKNEGVKPVYLKEFIVNGVNIIGKNANIVMVQKGEYANVKEATPVAKKTLRRPAPSPSPAVETIDLPA